MAAPTDCPHAHASILAVGEMVDDHGLEDGAVRSAVHAAVGCGWTWAQIGVVLGLPADEAAHKFAGGT